MPPQPLRIVDRDQRLRRGVSRQTPLLNLVSSFERLFPLDVPLQRAAIMAGVVAQPVRENLCEPREQLPFGGALKMRKILVCLEKRILDQVGRTTLGLNLNRASRLPPGANSASTFHNCPSAIRSAASLLDQRPEPSPSNDLPAPTRGPPRQKFSALSTMRPL